MQIVDMKFHNTKTTAEELCAREVALRICWAKQRTWVRFWQSNTRRKPGVPGTGKRKSGEEDADFPLFRTARCATELANEGRYRALSARKQYRPLTSVKKVQNTCRPVLRRRVVASNIAISCSVFPHTRLHAIAA